MAIRPQNIAQTSNFLLSPTKSMVAKGQPMVTKDGQSYTFKVMGLLTTHNGHKTSKYVSNFEFPIIIH